MKPIDPTEHETIIESFNDRANSMMDQLIEETLVPLRGRTITTIRKFKEPVTGEFKEYTVTVAIVGGHLDYDGRLVLVGSYTHPISGKPTVTPVNPF